MMNLFRKNEQTPSFVNEQPEMLELDEQELEQTTGGCGSHHHRRWHREYRRDHYGREIIIIVYED